MHAYEVRPRQDKRGFDLISDALHSVPSSPLDLVFFRIASVSGLCAETFASAVSLANRGLDDACIALSCDAESAFAVFAAPNALD